MKLWESILLGVIQGLTEFLPVSSSGHLVLTERLLGLPLNNLSFEVVVHLGTLVAVLLVFRRRVVRIGRGLFCGRVRYSKGRFRFPNKDTRWAWLLVMASIPALVTGWFLVALIERLLLKPLPVAVFLLITGAVLFGTRFIKLSPAQPNWWRSLVIGFSQMGTIIPGISRSGITISAGIYCGIQREEAAEFSFLLSIPLILGAGIMKISEMMNNGFPASETLILLIGAATAAISGYFALIILLKIIEKKRLYSFAYYCWLLGLLVIFLVR
jgi:undecaprenyl-diphosphatase